MLAIVLSSMMWASPAAAVSADKLIGHRCRTYDNAVTKENTIVALREVAGNARGAWCEIDVWRIADGSLIVFHDSTWGRVANHSTLPAGVQPSSLVKNATLAQVRKIRTKGGAEIPTLQEMIVASGAHGVPLSVEVKNSVPNAAAIVRLARDNGATVQYYRQPGSGCAAKVLDPLRKAGARVGLKLIKYSDCSVAQMRDKLGLSFVTQASGVITEQYVRDLRNAGIEVYARNASRSTSERLLRWGVAKLACEVPVSCRSWPGA